MNFRKHLSEPWTSVTKKSLVFANARHIPRDGFKPHEAGGLLPAIMRESTTSLSASGSSYHWTFSPPLALIFHLKLFGASSIIFFKLVTLSLTSFFSLSS